MTSLSTADADNPLDQRALLDGFAGQRTSDIFGPTGAVLGQYGADADGPAFEIGAETSSDGAQKG